jgi:hypothetical protein
MSDLKSSEDKLLKTKEHLQILLDEGFKIVNENRFEFNLYHSLFRRNIYGLESINLLLNDFNSNKKFREHSISILLRASLLDYLTTIYLLTFQLEKKHDPSFSKAYEIEVDKLMSEQIRRSLMISDYDKKISFSDHKEYCQTIDIYREKFSNLFDLTKPIDYNKPSNSLKYKFQDDLKYKVIKNRLDSFSNKMEGIHYDDVFYLYNIYSKYDHFGTTSMLFENMNFDLVLNNFLASIFHISEGIGFCIDLMIEETNCKSDFEKINSEIGLIRGIIHSKRN